MPALLIDLDGVVRAWPADNDARAEGAGRLPPGSIRAAAFAPELLGAVTTGAIDDPTWRSRVADLLTEQFPGCDAAIAVAWWSEGPGRLDDDVVALLRRVQCPVALVTNATSRLGSDLARLGAVDLFTVVVNSSEVGAAKPDPRIFHEALRRLGVPAEDALFVDDQAASVEAARALGLDGHVFVGAEALERELLARGFLAAG